MKKTSNKLVQQSNALIESSQKLTLVERRLFYYILSKLNPKEPKNTFQLKVEDFANDFPQMGNGTIYNQLKDGVQKLFKRDIQLITERGTTKVFHILQAQEYKDKEGFLSIKFSEDMMPLIFELKQKYTSMLLENFKNLDSVYSLRLYELLCQYQSMGKREITVEDLRFFLDCVDTNKEFKFFKLRVIEPAIKEINAKTNLLIHKVEYKRIGRKISSIAFEFCDKAFVQDTTAIETTQPQQRQVKINEEPSLKRYPRNVPRINLKGMLSIEEIMQHKMKFRVACYNLKIISEYEQKNKLSSRLYQAKRRSQQILGLYYSKHIEFNLTIKELNEIKDEIIN